MVTRFTRYLLEQEKYVLEQVIIPIGKVSLVDAAVICRHNASTAGSHHFYGTWRPFDFNMVKNRGDVKVMRYAVV